MALQAPAVPLWFRVFGHERQGFSPGRVYRAVLIADYSESAEAQVFCVSDLGYLWGVPQRECLCVNTDLARPATARERAMALPRKPPPSDWGGARP